MIDYCIQKALTIPFEKGKKRVYSVVLDSRGRVVSEGSNSYVKTHPIQKSYGVRSGHPMKEYLHAECNAIIRSKGRGVSLVVVRVDSKGNPCNARPCPVCSLAIKEHGLIKNICYTSDIGICNERLAI